MYGAKEVKRVHVTGNYFQSSPTALALIGTGQMGREISRLWQSERQGPIFAINSSSPASQWANIAKADVIIDFSSADAIRKVCQLACIHQKPLVIGTTGWSDLRETIHKEVSGALIACLQAPNFSIGAFAMRQAVQHMARMARMFDVREVTISETHHLDKRDTPSGTALLLSEDLQAAMGSTPTIESHRIEGIAGEHCVTFQTPWESLQLHHSAKNRLGFARGAIATAKWLKGQPPGWYSLEDFVASAFANKTPKEVGQ